MQSIGNDALEELEKRLASVLRDYPAKKARLLDAIGKKILARVRENIQSSGMKHSGGRMVGFQEYYVGALRGYVAVRAKGGAVKKRSGSPGALTNYTENGHKVRRPRQGSFHRYQAHATQARVRGYSYYYKTQSSVEGLAAFELLEFSEDLAKELEG